MNALDPEVDLQFSPKLQKELGLHVTVPEDCVLVTKNRDGPKLHGAGRKVLWADAQDSFVLEHNEFFFSYYKRAWSLFYCESGNGKIANASLWVDHPSQISFARRRRKLENKGWRYHGPETATTA